MINRRLLVQINWCNTKKKEKSEPSRVSNPGLQFRSQTCLPLLYGYLYTLVMLIAWIQNM
jgi:hypothetical protein